MKKDPIADDNKTTPSAYTPLFGGAKIVLAETPKAIMVLFYGKLSSWIMKPLL